MIPIRPRRSVLYMPGSHARALEKARTLTVDAVILDLEDAVAPDAKRMARDQVCAAVVRGFGEREVVIRINTLESPWGGEDLADAVKAMPNAILVPKVSSSQALHAVHAQLRRLGAPETIKVWAMIETPLAILQACEIAAIARDPESRLSCFVMGTNDLAKETGSRIVPGRAPMLPWLMTALAAARAHGLAILDGVYNILSDAEGFEAECSQGRDLGFDGKTLVHPHQIAAANRIFAPSPDEVVEAHAVLAAFAAPENAQEGAISLNGRMVERLHADMARRTVALAKAIAGMGPIS